MIDIAQLIVHHLVDSPVARLVAGFHLTKHMVMMLIAGGLMVLTVGLAAHASGGFGRRLRTVLEAYIEFIWQDIVEPAMGRDGRPFLHFFLTLFLFIFLLNLLGLVPFGATATGNISVTAALSLMTLVLIHVFGIRAHGFAGHFGHLVPPGVPKLLVPVIFLMELLGYFTRAIAMCIRLFANMTAGHLVILLFLGMILLFGQGSPAAGLGVAPISVGLTVGLYGLEMIVAFIQAYVFTILTAIFIGSALHPEH